MSKFVGVHKVPKKRLPEGHNCYQLDFQYQGKRYWEHVVTKTASEANDLRYEWIQGIKKQHGSVPVAGADYESIWEKLEKFYGDAKTRDVLREELERNVHQRQKADEVKQLRSLIKKVCCYREVFDRMFLISWEGRVDSVRYIDEHFFNAYKIHYCYTLGRLNGWRAEQIKAKAILNQMYERRFISKDQMEGMQKSSAWKREKRKKKEYPIISDTNMRALFMAIKSDRPDYHRIYTTMLRTGRRVEEVTLTLRKNILFEQGKFKRLVIRAEDTKMDRSSQLDTIDPEFEELLWGAYQESEKYNSPYLFLNRKHKKCDQRKLCDYLRKKSEEVIGVGITNHYFRHRFLTECGQKRITWAEVSKVSGLKDQAVYMENYDHSTPTGQQKVFALTEGIA